MTNAYIAIVGLDADNKRRAGKFKAKDLALVQKAADAMKMFVAVPKSDEAAKAVAKLLDGKLSVAAGKATVPVHKGKWDPLLDTFIALPNVPIEAPTAATAILWPDLVKGCIVIAPELDPSEFGFWRAEIVGVSPDKKNVTVRWLDNLRQAPTTMPREQVAILHPKFL